MRRRRVEVGLVVVVVSMCSLARVAEAQIWQQHAKLTAENGAAGDYFGWSVAISGNTAIVGAKGHESKGAAYLFDATTRSQLDKLTAADATPGAELGYSVAISGNIGLVGARFDAGGATGSGSAYLFDLTTSSQPDKLAAGDAAASDQFGSSVAISGNTAIVGAHKSDGPTNAGSAYLFNVSTGGELGELTPSDPAAYDYFGRSVGISGNLAIVGAYGNDDAGDSSGSAYVFDVDKRIQLAKLTATDPTAGAHFGWSVAISGNTAIVGAMGHESKGAAYLFNASTGEQLARLTASDAEVGVDFGYSVAISGNTAIVGAKSDDAVGTDSGSAYLFDVTTRSQLRKLVAADADDYDWFGYSVAISGSTAVVGACRDEHAGDYSGSAYVFIIPEPCTLALLSMGAVGLLAYAWRKRRTRTT